MGGLDGSAGVLASAGGGGGAGGGSARVVEGTLGASGADEGGGGGAGGSASADCACARPVASSTPTPTTHATERTPKSKRRSMIPLDYGRKAE